MSRRLARQRGYDLERQVAKDLRDIGISAMRNLEYQEGSVDVVSDSLEFAFQCKNQKSPSIWKAIIEAREGCRKKDAWKGYTPVAVVRRGRQTLVIMNWKDFLDNLEKIKICGVE